MRRNRPEGLRLGFGELHGRRHHELLVGPDFLPYQVHVVGRLVLGEGRRNADKGQRGKQCNDPHEQLS
jgi:hypothetical protein